MIRARALFPGSVADGAFLRIQPGAEATVTDVEIDDSQADVGGKAVIEAFGNSRLTLRRSRIMRSGGTGAGWLGLGGPAQG